MNTQKIKILLTALEMGSLTKAGAQLGYTQSAMTQMMKSLEEEVGFPLLVKSNRGVTATHEAQELLPTMKLLMETEERFNQEVDAMRGMHRGTVRIGSFISTSMHWMPKVLKHFSQNYPEVKFEIEECGEDDMLNGLAEHTMDLVLLSKPEQVNFDFIEIQEDPMVVVYSDEYDLSGYDYVPTEVLRDMPLILTDPGYDHDARKVFDHVDFEPNIQYTSKNDFAVVSMVNQGLGVAILPELVIAGFPGVIRYRMLDPEVYRTLGIGVNSYKKAGPLVRFVIDYIKENIK